MERDLLTLLDEVLTVSGFKRSGKIWRKQNPESIDVIGVQKSSFGEEFYINLGVFFPSLETLTRPATKDCHVQVRFNRVHPDPDMLELVLYPSAESKDAIGVLKWGFLEAENTFFARFRTLELACQFLAQHPTTDFSILAPLYDHCKMQIDGPGHKTG